MTLLNWRQNVSVRVFKELKLDCKVKEIYAKEEVLDYLQIREMQT